MVVAVVAVVVVVTYTHTYEYMVDTFLRYCVRCLNTLVPKHRNKILPFPNKHYSHFTAREAEVQRY